ncbi:hypothetical protein M8J75_000369 [Diaphorina citri]|nr:hypothetical protein M8J75_000369 [Diaphorina citri]
MLGAVSPDSFDTFHSYSNTFQMPFITPWFPEKVLAPSSGFLDYAISMRPDYHQAIIDTVKYYGWKNIIYMYDSHDGLLRLQQIYQSLKPGSDSFQVVTVRRIQNVSEAIDFLHDLELLDRWGFKHIVLDCATDMAKAIVVSHVRKVTLGKRTYHYLLSGLIMDDRWETEVIEYGAINITGFRLINNNKKFVRDFLDEWKKLDPKTYIGAGKDSISAQSALMYDAVLVIVETFNKLLKRKPDLFKANVNRRGQMMNNGSRMDCNTSKGWVTPWEHGDKISKNLRKVEIEGLTGDIRFNNDSKRMNYTLHVVEMTVNSAMVKVAEWNDIDGFVPDATVKYQRQKQYGGYDNKTYIVTGILAAPYLSEVTDAQDKEGNDKYEGFCKDLADLLAQRLKISYKFRLVKDNKYGAINKSNPSEWDGMVGELIRREVDMAIAPLSITSERERVVDFSKPFMTLGISIMIKKPSKQKPRVLSFLDPLSEEIWVAIIFSYIMVSVVLFLVSRFSPHEWRLLNYSDPGHPHHSPSPHHGPSPPSVIANDFSLSNSFWFSLGAFMQQGSDISPRSISGRIVGAVWWFFTLILISSYTANLAAFLTVERMVNPINSVEDLADQSDVLYGTVKDASTYHFFETATFDTYRKMYYFMQMHKDKVFVSSETEGVNKVRSSHGKYAFLIESPRNDYENARQPCDTMKVGNNLDVKGFGVATPIGSPLKNDVNMEILKLLEAGELSRLQKKWWIDTSQCKSSKSQDTHSELALSNVAGVFYILGAGLLLAMAVALVEFCYNTHMEASNNKVPVSDVMKNKARMTIGAREFDNGRYYASGNTLNPLEDQVHSNTHTQV